ncbi:hypothetical protein B0T26DRAFT_675591 [Lasiosphaeria miniovina]|uniref:Uncharacterized protein n=1 Tax=Lasiosphaeria miniovina TaxID=1954250 RepID=A0AA40DUV3_9PEZI|nr:uncharacterized protein B0T26DRAFT_675591 [Lasiosphaeria miniovina]KAK0717259.1 hypothetical protein B0T26DRAFT_675591 [Lasiosphaeria miniovina]
MSDNQRDTRPWKKLRQPGDFFRPRQSSPMYEDENTSEVYPSSSWSTQSSRRNPQATTYRDGDPTLPVQNVPAIIKTKGDVADWAQDIKYAEAQDRRDRERRAREQREREERERERRAEMQRREAERRERSRSARARREAERRDAGSSRPPPSSSRSTSVVRTTTTSSSGSYRPRYRSQSRDNGDRERDSSPATLRQRWLRRRRGGGELDFA